MEHAKKLAEVEGQRAEENKMTARQLRKRSIYLAGAFGVAVLLLLIAGALGFQAQNARLLATSRELAAASIGNLDVDPERSILLALKAIDTHYTIEAEDALHRAIQASRVQLVLQAHEPGFRPALHLARMENILLLPVRMKLQRYSMFPRASCYFL